MCEYMYFGFVGRWEDDGVRAGLGNYNRGSKWGKKASVQIGIGHSWFF